MANLLLVLLVVLMGLGFSSQMKNLRMGAGVL